MKRRHFIAVSAAAGIGGPLFRSGELYAAQDPLWKRDGVSSVARIGVLTPDFDPVPESELWAMAPQGISLHAARVPRQPGGARAFADPPNVDTAVGQLVGLAPRVILFAYTSSSYVLGAAADASVRARLENRSHQIPVLLTCPAAVEALRALEARRIALIHPPWFTDEVNTQGSDYFKSQGFEVLLSARITPLRSFSEVPPSEVYDWVLKNVPSESQAVFIGGNGLRSVGAIQALETRLNKPVLTANQVLLWQALRIVGTPSTVTQYGRIFAKVPSVR